MWVKQGLRRDTDLLSQLPGRREDEDGCGVQWGKRRVEEALDGGDEEG